MRSTSSLLRAGVLAPAAIATVFCLAAPANAATVSVNWNCRAAGIATTTMTASVTATAPSTAASGSTVTITLAPSASTVPTSVSGITVNHIKNQTITFAAPTNSTLVSASASGGTVPGTVSTSGGNVVLSIPGQINAGTTFTPPTVTINVTAGAAGTPIISKYAGTSYTSPGMTQTTNIKLLGVNSDVASSCYPSPSPTLTSTTVS